MLICFRTRPLFTLLFFSLLFNSGRAEFIAPTYGSAGSATHLSIFSNEATVGFDSTTTGLIALGYFNTGVDVAGEAGKVEDPASLSTFLGQFNHLHSSNFSTVLAPGFISTGEVVLAGASTGKIPYVLTLGGISEWDERNSANEIGLFTDTGFDTFPTAAVPADPYDMTSVTYDSVLLGIGHDSSNELFPSLDLGNPNIAQMGNVYASQAVPEPSTYALFLGVFSLGFVIWRKRAVKNTAKE